MSWSFGKIAQRSDAPSWFSSPVGNDAEIASVLRFWDAANRLTGGYRTVLRFLAASVERSPSRLPLTVLDLGCAGGGLSRELARWARKSRRSIRILAVDPAPAFLDAAKKKSADFPEIEFAVRDAETPAFLQAQQFDYVIGSGFLHREENQKLPALLRTADRLAKRGVALEDGARDVRLLWLMRAAARFAGGKNAGNLIEEDFSRRYTASELREAAVEAKWEATSVREVFLCRLCLFTERALITATNLASLTGLAGA